MAIGLILFSMPTLMARDNRLAVGLGVSSMPRTQQVPMGQAYTFEGGRFYNTGDEAYSIETTWIPTGGSLYKDPIMAVIVTPNNQLVQPDEAYNFFVTVTSPNKMGSLSGYIDVAVNMPENWVPHDAPEDGVTVGGIAMPGSTVEFNFDTYNPEQSQLPNTSIFGGGSMLLGLVLLGSEEVDKRKKSK